MEDVLPGRKWSILLVLSLALAIIILDTTLLNVSLASIIRDLHTDIQGIQWVITGYSLTLAALTITGGRLGDLFGRKRMFVVGAIIFAVGSLITAISRTLPEMIIGEAIIEGIGAALMMPATASILVSNFKGRERAIGFGVWGAVAGSAAAFGPIVGGYLATNYSWRYGFGINVFVAALLVLGSMIIPETRDTEEKPSLDLIGAVTSGLGLLLFVFGVIESSTYGWWQAKQIFMINGIALGWGTLSIVPTAMILGTVLLALFVVWELEMERSGQTPLVSMKLFLNRQFISGALVTAILSLAMSGIIFSIPVFLQSVRRLDALHTGYSLLPMSLTLLVVAPLGAIFSSKIRPKLLIQAGLLANIAATVVLYNAFSVDATASSFALGLGLFGFGMGLVMSQVNNLTLSAVSPQEAGEASGVNNTLRQLGTSFGSAIIGAVLLSTLSANLVSGIQSSAVIPPQLKTQIAQAASTQTSNVEFGGGAQLPTKVPQVITDEITIISYQATVEANKKALLYGIFFAILGFLVSFSIPNKQNLDHRESIAVKSGH